MAVQARRTQASSVRQAAADELALRLGDFADALVKQGVRPKRLPYGPALAVGLGMRRSPRGILLYQAGMRLQMLLPDGRLWQYHERRNIEGIYYDARTDHARAMNGSIPVEGGRFNFLGAVLAKYNFGYLESENSTDLPNGYELGAIIGEDGSSAQYLKADVAFAAIAKTL